MRGRGTGGQSCGQRGQGRGRGVGGGCIARGGVAVAPGSVAPHPGGVAAEPASHSLSISGHIRGLIITTPGQGCTVTLYNSGTQFCTCIVSSNPLPEI